MSSKQQVTPEMADCIILENQYLQLAKSCVRDHGSENIKEVMRRLERQCATLYNDPIFQTLFPAAYRLAVCRSLLKSSQTATGFAV